MPVFFRFARELQMTWFGENTSISNCPTIDTLVATERQGSQLTNVTAVSDPMATEDSDVVSGREDRLEILARLPIQRS